MAYYSSIRRQLAGPRYIIQPTEGWDLFCQCLSKTDKERQFLNWDVSHAISSSQLPSRPAVLQGTTRGSRVESACLHTSESHPTCPLHCVI